MSIKLPIHTSVRLIIACTLFLGLLAPAHAQVDSLSKCLADNTTGKDRKELAGWIFVAMSAHPEIRQLATLTDDISDKTSQTMGRLVTRLLSDNCPKETQAAVKFEGNQALRRAFESLGELAMIEIMSDNGVKTSIGRFERYLDRKKLDAIFGAK